MSLNGRLQSSRSGEDVLRTLEEAERDGEMVDNMNRVVALIQVHRSGGVKRTRGWVMGAAMPVIRRLLRMRGL